MIKRRILLAVGIVAVLGLTFGAGWRLNQYLDDKEYSDSLTPAARLVFAVASGDQLDETYNSTSPLYKGGYSLEDFKESVSSVKGYEVSSSRSYVGDSNDTQTIATLTKGNSTIDISVSTVKEDGVWAVSTVIVGQPINLE